MKSLFSSKINRKGQTAYEDIFFVMVFLFFAGILFFFVYFTYNTHIKPELDIALSGATNNSLVDANGEQSINISNTLSQTSGGIGAFNTFYPLLLIGLIVMLVVSAYNMGSHPVFFFVTLLVLIVVLILSVVLSNTYHQITSADEFGSTINTFNITNIFMKYLPFIMVIIVIIVIIIMSTQGGGGSNRI